MHDLKELKGYISSVPSTISIGVAGVCIENKKVLLVKNTKTDYWSFPGGHLLESESLIAGLKREILEETDHEISIIDGPIFFQYDLNEKLTLLLFFYKIQFLYQTQKFKSLNNEVEDAKWFDIKSLPVKIYPNTKIIINHFTK